MSALGPSWKLGILGISAAVLVAVASLPPGSPTGLPDVLRPAGHPVAALAWASANCDARLYLKPGAHLEHAEVLMRVAAELDQARAAYPLAEVCRDAIVAAKPAIARASASALVTEDIPSAKTASNDR